MRGAPSREHVTSRLCARSARFGRLCGLVLRGGARETRAISRLELEANVRLNVRRDLDLLEVLFQPFQHSAGL